MVIGSIMRERSTARGLTENSVNATHIFAQVHISSQQTDTSSINSLQEGWLSPTERASVSAHFGLPWVRPWDNLGKCYMDRKRIQCWSNALQHIPIYLQPFTSYSEILVATFSYPLHLTVPIGIPGKRLVLRKLESWGYQAVKTV